MNEDYSNCTFVFDIDGTLCPIKKEGESYSDIVPYSDIIEKIRRCKSQGAKIILFTSRNMKSYGGNLGVINKKTAPILYAWLEKWDIPYDEIYFGKPWPGEHGFYVDDRSIRPDEFVNGELEDMEKICRDCRKRLR